MDDKDVSVTNAQSLAQHHLASQFSATTFLGRTYSFWNDLNKEFDCDLDLLRKANLMEENIKLRGIISRLTNHVDQMKELIEEQYK